MMIYHGTKDNITLNKHVFFNPNTNCAYTPETNMSPENQWLEDVFPTKKVPF